MAASAIVIVKKLFISNLESDFYFSTIYLVFCTVLRTMETWAEHKDHWVIVCLLLLLLLLVILISYAH